MLRRVADDSEDSEGLMRSNHKQEENSSSKACKLVAVCALCCAVTVVALIDRVELAEHETTIEQLRKDVSTLNSEMISLLKRDKAADSGMATVGAMTVEAFDTHLKTAIAMAPKRTAVEKTVCHARPLNGNIKMNWQGAPSTDMSEGVWHADDAYFEKCPETAGCGKRLEYDLNTCMTHNVNGEEGVHTGTWTIGPFNSTGGFDWWLVKFSQGDKLVPFPGNTAVGKYTIAFQEGDPSKGSGPRLSFPPLHNHHTTARGGNPEIRFFRQGDDGLCSADPDGTSCYERDMMKKGYVQSASTLNGSSPLFSEILVNDVRPMGSPPMLWYVNFTFTFLEPEAVVERDLEPTSLRMMGHTFKNGAFSATVDVPGDVDSFAIVETRWDINAKIITDPDISWHHSHNVKYHQTFLMRGTAAELGLAKDGYYSSGCQTPPVTNAGFKDHVEMVDHLKTTCPDCFDFKKRLLCSVDATHAMVDAPWGEYAYDRRSALKCAGEFLDVRKDEAVTWISFFGPRVETYNPTGPNIPDPNALPVHTTWWLYYKLEGEEAKDKTNYKYLVSNPALMTKFEGLGRPNNDICMDLDTLFTASPADYFVVTHPPQPEQLAAWGQMMAERQAKAQG